MFHSTRSPLVTTTLVLAIIILAPIALGVLLQVGPILIGAAVILGAVVAVIWYSTAILHALLAAAGRGIAHLWDQRRQGPSAHDWAQVRAAADARTARRRQRQSSTSTLSSTD